MTSRVTESCTASTGSPLVSDATITTSPTLTITNTDKPQWTRLNFKGIYHDNRRLLKHRARNCECFVCYREIYKLPPKETHQEYVSSVKNKIEEREIKKAKRKAKKEVKNGKQGSMRKFLLSGQL
jgi:predicted GIY-YIG superfamily endonuclease